MDTRLKGVAEGRKGSLFEFLMEVKRAHPTKVVLVRVGEFYETWGFDAVVLVQHAGLNPMGQAGVPRAGCPKQNVHAVLRDLTGAGHACAVCEEVPQPYTYGARAKRKQRFIAGVVTPASPEYVYNHAARAEDAEFRPVPPVFGVARTRQGFAVAEVDVEARRCRVRDGLTEEAVVGQLATTGFSPPLYLHASVAEGGGGRSLRALAQGSPTVGFQGAPGRWQAAMLNLLKVDLGLEATEEFAVSRAASEGRPRPLYLATAANVGLVPAPGGGPGVPDLVACALPPDAPAMCQHFVRRLLLSPPPPDVADAVREACAVLLAAEEALPGLPCVPSGKLAKLISAGEANHLLFAELAHLVHAVERFAGSPAFAPAAGPLLAVVAHETGLAVGPPARLREAAGTVLAAVAAVLDPSLLQDLDGNLGADLDPAPASRASEAGAEALGSAAEEATEAVQQLAAALEEPFRGRVRPDLPELAAALAELAGARAAVLAALLADLVPAATRARAEAEAEAGSRRAGQQARVAFDPLNQAVALRGRVPTAVAAEFGLVRPRDRHGGSLGDRWSSTDLEAALDRYRRGAFEAARATTAALKGLAAELRPWLADLLAAAVLATAARALHAHVGEARRRRWCAPALGPAPLGAPGEPLEPLRCEGLWPFWMDAGEVSALVVGSRASRLSMPVSAGAGADRPARRRRRHPFRGGGRRWRTRWSWMGWCC